jgi:DNA-directed RNA polymerase specialized sigma24 family protein
MTEISERLEDQLERTNSLLRALLRVTLDQQEKMTTQRKVEILDSAGLRVSEIASILGVSSNSVSVRLSQARKKGEATAKQGEETRAESTG